MMRPVACTNTGGPLCCLGAAARASSAWVALLLELGGRKETEGAWKVAAARRDGRSEAHTASCCRRVRRPAAAALPRMSGRQGDRLLAGLQVGAGRAGPASDSVAAGAMPPLRAAGRPSERGRPAAQRLGAGALSRRGLGGGCDGATTRGGAGGGWVARRAEEGRLGGAGGPGCAAHPASNHGPQAGRARSRRSQTARRGALKP